MKTKILMVYPVIPTTYWSFKYAMPFVGNRYLMPPLGLLTIASLIPENYDIKLIDLNVTDINLEDIEAADLVFISSMIVQKKSFDHVVQLCNECHKPVVAGGPYPTSSYHNIKGVDYFVLNEAEITLPKFLRDYESGVAQNVYYDEEKPDITKTPPPRIDLIDMNVYSCMALQFSRGCPFNCEFCDIIEMFGRKPRTKLPEQFINEMEYVYNAGFRGPIFIVDDNFIGNKNRVRELLKRLVEWQNSHNHPFSLFTEASIGLAQDDKLMDLMVEAGFSMIFVGIETPHTETLEITQKQQNLKMDMYESVKKIQSKGLEVSGGFIIGFDADPENIFDLQIDFIQRAGIPMAMIGMLMALPNTQLYRRLQRENRLLGDTHGNNTHELKLNFIPRMPKQKLIYGYKRVITEIYTPRNYFNRSITLLKRLPKKRFISRPIIGNDLIAFMLSLLKQTFTSYGIYYLRFLMQALWHNRWNFPLAVNLAIKGYHFFRITDEIIKADEFSTMLDTSLKSLEKQVEEIFESGNEAIAYKMDKCKFKLKHKMKKRYLQLDHSLQSYLNDIFNNFEAYCEKIITYGRDRSKFHRNLDEN